MRFSFGLLILLLVGCDQESVLSTSPDTAGTSTSGVAVGEGRAHTYGCELVEFIRARPQVDGRRVDVDVRVQGYAFHATWGRVVFWPNGRHHEPRILSEVFETGNDDDFPAAVRVGYRYGDEVRGEIVANVDYEMLHKCYDWRQERFVLGGLDEHGTCIEGEYIVLQCDRGVSFTLN